MATAQETLSGKLGLDTTDFKTGISAANRELRVLESGFRAGVASLGDWANSATGLEARVRSLTGQMDIQKLKVAALREEYERVKTEKGENSRAAQDLEIKLNKETETLGKMESELGQTEAALSEMGQETEDSGEQAQEAGEKYNAFGAILSGVAGIAKGVATAVLAVAAGVIAAAAAIVTLVLSSATAADELVDLSVKTDISVQRLQEMKYAGDQLGVSLDTMTSANARLIRSMDDASQKPYGDMAKAFDTLGVSVTDAEGNLRSSQDVFDDTIDALGKIENPAERDALAMQLFGKSAQELNPLIKAGSDELARLTEEAHKNGAVVSTETVEGLAGLKDQLGGLKGGLLGVAMTLAGAFTPLFSGVLSDATGYLQSLVGIVDNFAGTSNFAPAIAGVFTNIVKDIAAAAPQMIRAGVDFIMAIVNSISASLPILIPMGIQVIKTLITSVLQNLPRLVEIGLNAIVTLAQGIVDALPTLVPLGARTLFMIVDSILQNLPLLIDAGLQTIIALANGLASSLQPLIPAVVQAIITIVQVLIENLPMLIDAALQIILALTYGLIAAIPILLPAIPQIIKAMLDAINLSLPLIADAALLIIFSLATALIGGKSEMGKSGFELLNEFIAKMKTMGAQIQSIGKFMVQGIWEGIKGATAWLYDRIKEFIDGIIQSILDAEGAKSPAKRFMPAGKFAVQGFMSGMLNEAMNFDKNMNALMSNVQFSPAFASGGGSSNVTNNNGNSVTINGMTFPSSDMRSITLADVMDYLNKRG